MKNQWHIRVFTNFVDRFPFEREQEDEFHGISKNQIKIVIYAKILQKSLEYVARAVGYVNKVKDSFEPDSNQRPKDINNASTVLRSTNWAIEGRLMIFEFKGKTLFHEKPMTYKGIY